MTRTMADACNPANLPSGVDLHASYVDGRCASNANTPVRISCLATDAGNVGDCEPGNPGPSAWVAWVQRRRAAGVDPTIYCADDSEGPFFDGFKHLAVEQAFIAAGVAQPHYWVTHPGATLIPPYAVAVQNQLGVNNDAYDLSIVRDYWPGIDPAPPIATPIKGRKMLVQFQATVVAGKYKGVEAAFLSDMMRFRWIQNPQQLTDIEGLVGSSLIVHTPGVSVADPLAFGEPADPVTAAMLGLSFGAELTDF